MTTTEVVVCVAAFILGLFFIRMPTIVLAIAITTQIAVPSLASSLILGQTSYLISPAEFVILGALTVSICLGPIRRWITPFYVVCWLLLVGAFIALSATLTLAQTGFTAFLYFISIIVVPVLITTLISLGRLISPDLARNLTYLVITTAVGESSLVITESIEGTFTPYTTQAYASYYNPGYAYRPMGTFGNPIEASAFLVGAILLTRRLRIGWRLPISALLLIALLLTESRLAVILGLIGFLYIVISSVSDPLSRVVLGVVSLCGLFSALSFTSSALSRLVTSGSTADVSTAIRLEAYSYTFDHISSILFLGGGFLTSSTIKGSALTSSLENSYAMLAFDLGLPLVMLYVTILILTIAFRAPGPVAMSARLATVAVAILAAGTSGFMNAGAFGWFMWVIAGIAQSVPYSYTEYTDGACNNHASHVSSKLHGAHTALTFCRGSVASNIGGCAPWSM